MYILSLYFFVVMKAQSLKFFFFISNGNMGFSQEENQSLESCWSFRLFTLGLRRRLLIVIVNSVAYIWAFIQISSVVYSEICMQSFTQHLHRFVSSSPDDPKPDRGLVPFIVFLCWVHLGFSCVSLTLNVTPGLRLDSKLKELQIIVHFLNKNFTLHNQKKKKEKQTVDIKTKTSIVANICRP